MADNKSKSPSKGSQKTFASKRTINAPQGDRSHGANVGPGPSDQQQDAARRLGSFEGKGEHARTGNRGHE